ncbi:MAG: hypothetical protein GX803_05455 [Lentisphaerae bacterium]|jgi:hypothetical protein|nr:hypothetical protein [Lentisphaerota bacterium]
MQKRIKPIPVPFPGANPLILDHSRDKSGPDARQVGRSGMDILRAPNNAADGLESSRRRATGMKNNFFYPNIRIMQCNNK